MQNIHLTYNIYIMITQKIYFSMICILVIIMLMPSMQRMLDLSTRSKPKQNSDNDKRSFTEKGLKILSEFLRALFIQPLKILRAMKCIWDPDNQLWRSKHDELKVLLISLLNSIMLNSFFISRFMKSLESHLVNSSFKVQF